MGVCGQVESSSVHKCINVVCVGSERESLCEEEVTSAARRRSLESEEVKGLS